jgi:hypothetical protein
VQALTVSSKAKTALSELSHILLKQWSQTLHGSKYAKVLNKNTETQMLT